MLLTTFKFHQSDFQLKLNDKFVCAKLVLKAQLKYSTVLSPVPITTALITLSASQRAYVFYIYNAVNPIYLHLLYFKNSLSPEPSYIHDFL